jgi:hypothetical protein
MEGASSSSTCDTPRPGHWMRSGSTRPTSPTCAGWHLSGSVLALNPTSRAACVLGLDAGWPLERVARFACAAGALVVTKLGPMEGVPTRAEVEGLLGEIVSK